MRLDLPLRHKQNWTLLFEDFGGYPDGVPLRIFSLLAFTSNYVYDVGMNAGLYLYHGAAAAHAGAVIAGFEPNQELALLVRKNVAANGLNNVRIETRGCSDRDGTAELLITDTDHMSSLMPEFLTASGRQILRRELVETVALDAYVRSEGLRMDLVKIDVEGHEEQVLAGAWESICQWYPALLIEIADTNLERTKAVQLYDLGYRCFHFVGGGLVELENPIDMVKLRRAGDVNYLFAKRDEHLQAVYEFSEQLASTRG